MPYRPNRAPRSSLEALRPTRVGTWMLRRRLIDCVRAGLSWADAQEIALVVGATIDRRESIRLLGVCPAWLQSWLLAFGIAAMTCRVVPEPVRRLSQFDCLLALGLYSSPLRIWQMCRRGLGIEHGWTRRDGEQAAATASWQPMIVASLCVLVCVVLLSQPHGTAIAAAFVPFYVQAGGNSMNAGSTTANAADVTQTNGNWSTATNIFAAAAGTPFSAVNANVDYASIYPDGTTTGAGYVALITAVNSGGASITLSSTIKYGTAPTTSATARSCKVNGAWADETALVQLGSGVIPQSTKVNWQQASYTLAASRTVAMAGATTTPFWASAYNTTPGDLDGDTTNVLAKPTLALGAGFSLSFTGTYQIVTGFNITGNISGTVLSLGGSNGLCARCRVENTSSNAAARAVNANSSAAIAYSWFKCPATGTSNGVATIAVSRPIVGCIAEGGGLAGFDASGTNATFVQCIAKNNTGIGFRQSTSLLNLYYCTISNPSSDGVKWTGTPSGGSIIAGCLFRKCGGWGINQAGGTNSANVYRFSNAMYSVTSGRETGFGDMPELFPVTLASDPCASDSDLTLQAGVTGLFGGGFPGIFENQTFTGYDDPGAVQHASAGAAGMLVPSGMSGGFRG